MSFCTCQRANKNFGAAGYSVIHTVRVFSFFFSLCVLFQMFKQTLDAPEKAFVGHTTGKCEFRDTSAGSHLDPLLYCWRLK